jgi:hypothetical protein
MKYRYAAFFALSLSACTVATQNNVLDGDFHPPLVYANWQAENYVLSGGAKACAISSGANGITVFLSERPEKGSIAVKSNRLMNPGTTLTVSAGGSTYQTSDEFFSRENAKSLVASFGKGDKAYMEWSELSGPTSARVHVQNVVRLDDFQTKWKQCESVVSPQR